MPQIRKTISKSPSRSTKDAGARGERSGPGGRSGGARPAAHGANAEGKKSANPRARGGAERPASKSAGRGEAPIGPRSRAAEPARTGGKSPSAPAKPAYGKFAAKSAGKSPAKSPGKSAVRPNAKPDAKVSAQSIGGPSGRPSGKPSGKPSTNPAAKPYARPPAKSAAGAARSEERVLHERPRPKKPEPVVEPVVNNAVRHVKVGPNDDGQRVDNFLLKRLPGVPRSHVYQLLRSGQVRVDGGRAKPERKLSEGEEVRIPPVRTGGSETPLRAPDALLNRVREAIIYEDEHYLAICKPAGLAAHGGTGVPFGVIEVARSWNRYDYLELVHRLDRDTSGVLLLAKSREALLRGQRALRDGLATKRYFALLAGRLTGGPYDVDAALVKSRVRGGERYVEVDDEDGKPSHSRFTVSALYRDATLCDVEIFSGRTHQIRVHALALGAPVAGDRKYGNRDDQQALRDRGLRRMFLHSHFLQLPAQGEFPALMLNAPLVDELREFLDQLRN